MASVFFGIGHLRSSTCWWSLSLCLSAMACSPSDGDDGDPASGGASPMGVGGSDMGPGSGGDGGDEAAGGTNSGGSNGMSGGADSSGTGGMDEGSSGGGSPGATDGRRLSVQVYGLRGEREYVHLSVQDSTPSDTVSPCEFSEAGGCRLSRCPTDGPEPTALAPWYQGEETVEATVTQETAEGLQVSTASLVLDPNEDIYPQTLEPKVAFAGEERVQISMSGGALPPFEIDTTMPLFLITTTPANDTSDADKHFIDMSAAEGLTLNWERGVDGVSYHVLQYGASVTGDERYSLSCEFESTLGEGHIDASLLTDLLPGTIFLTVTARTLKQEVEGGSYEFRIFDNTINPEKSQAIALRVTE